MTWYDSCAPVIVLVGNGGGLLWDIKVPEDAADIEGHSANVASCHELCFCGGEGDGWLKFCFIGDCTARKLDADPAK